MADEKQLNAVRFFCKHPFSNRGSKKSKANFRNWSDLVQQISYFDFGHTQQDRAIVQIVDLLIRREFSNTQNWERSVSQPVAHHRILSIIRGGLITAGAA